MNVRTKYSEIFWLIPSFYFVVMDAESAGKMNLGIAISDKEVLILLATKHMAERSKRGRFKNLFSWG